MGSISERQNRSQDQLLRHRSSGIDRIASANNCSIQKHMANSFVRESILYVTFRAHLLFTENHNNK